MWRTTEKIKESERKEYISIHVPRVEDDIRIRTMHTCVLYFNPRPPCGGRLAGFSVIAVVLDFNPRPPCGGRLAIITYCFPFFFISIHVPRVEDDLFQHINIIKVFISIHVPRVEDDSCNSDKDNYTRYFNPRPPCGGRLYLIDHNYLTKIFQSTSPVWRTTGVDTTEYMIKRISIHVPRVEDDGGKCLLPRFFYISIHVPRVEDDTIVEGLRWAYPISIHVPRVEDDQSGV